MLEKNNPPILPSEIEEKTGWFTSFRPEHRNALSFTEITKFWSQSAGVALFQISIILPIIVCSYLIAKFGDPFALSVFGLGLTVNSLVFGSFLIGVSEQVGVHASKLFAQKKYSAIGNLIGKAAVTLILTLILSFYLFSKSVTIILAFGMERSLAEATHEFLKIYQLSAPFTAFNSAAVSLLISQKISSPIMYVNILTIGAMCIFGQIFIVNCGWKEMGVPWARLIQESLGTVCYIYLLVKKGKRQVFDEVRLRWIFRDYLYFLKETLLTVSNFYSESLCFEINIYYLGLLHNLTEMALWVTLTNTTGIVYFVSVAIANTVRTFIGHMIGKGKIAQAKIKSVHYFIYILMFTYLVTVFLLVAKYKIGWVFTGNEYMSVQMAYMYVANCMIFFPTFSLLSLNTITRCLDYHDLLFKVNTIYNPLLTAIMSYLFCFVFVMKAIGINIGYTIAKSSITIYLFYTLYWNLEWHANEDALSRQTSLIESEERSRGGV